MSPIMHPADIVALVKKRQTSMAALSRDAGLSRSALGVSLRQPFRRAEEVLIRFLGLPPQDLWPDRYDAHGTRLVEHGARAHRGRPANTSKRRRRSGQ